MILLTVALKQLVHLILIRMLFLIAGSLFYNYKGKFSIVLFALVDANYKFLFVDVGQPGSANDARIWQESRLKKALDSGALNLPPSRSGVNYHFIGESLKIPRRRILYFSQILRTTCLELKKCNFSWTRARVSFVECYHDINKCTTNPLLRELFSIVCHVF